jgi:hypothetical protein
MDFGGNGFWLGRIYFAVAILTTSLTLILPTRAWAQFDQETFYVRQPEVEKGETEFEEHGAFFSGPSSEENLSQSHEIEATYGLTDRWQIMVEGLLEQPVHESLEGTEVETGAQYEIIKRKGDGFDLAFRAEYEAELEHDEADEILFGPILKYVWGRASTTFDAFFTGQVGPKTDTEGLGFQYNWQFRYQLNPRFGIGTEAFGNIEDLANAGSSNNQPHRVGPVLYINLGEEIQNSGAEREETEHEQKTEALEFNVAAGVLFGLTEVTSDVTFKVDAELEF